MAKNRLGGNLNCNGMGQINMCCFVKKIHAVLLRKTERITI
jgi:hypothetical protein